MPRPSASKQALAAEVWRLLLQTAMHHVGRTTGTLQQLGLTPGHMKALLLLDADGSLPMGSLAQQFGCDASSMTWLVDRLEERGLAERRGRPGDRRVKTVALTPEGVRTKSDLEDRLYQAPEAFAGLDREVLSALRTALESGQPPPRGEVAAGVGHEPAQHRYSRS